MSVSIEEVIRELERGNLKHVSMSSEESSEYCDEMSISVFKLLENYKKLKEALEFYADTKNYGWDDVPTITERDTGDLKGSRKGGKTARQALKEINE